jgi:phage terminase large subunit-like protein
MASANRLQSLFISITTADYDRDSVCNERYEYACGVRDGKVPDLTFLPVMYEAKPTDDWTLPETWAKANPNLGVSVDEAYLRNECEQALRIPRNQNRLKRLHLNMRTKQDELWLDSRQWGECIAEAIDDPPYGSKVFGGLDLSSKRGVATGWQGLRPSAAMGSRGSRADAGRRAARPALSTMGAGRRDRNDARQRGRLRVH